MVRESALTRSSKRTYALHVGISSNESRGHPIRKPELSDYDITGEQYNRQISLLKEDGLVLWVLPVFIVAGILGTMTVVYLVTDDIGLTVTSGFFALFPGSWVTALLAMGIVIPFSWFMRCRDRRSGIVVQVQQYHDARRAYDIAVAQAEEDRVRAIQERERQEREQRHIAEMQRLAQCERWTSLSGKEFEAALGGLLQGLGCSVELTGRTGDEGIDLVVRRGRKTTVVQCKQQKDRVSPAVIRELYGAMVAYGADQALLACTGGFTRGTEAFAEGKLIILWSMDDLGHWATEWDRRESGDE